MNEKKDLLKKEDVFRAVDQISKMVQQNGTKVFLAGCSVFILIVFLGLIIDRNSAPRAKQDTSEPPIIAGTTPEEPQQLTISPTAVSIDVGETTQLTISPDTEAVDWVTSDSTVATVSGGTVTGVAPGSTTIAAISEGGKVTCMVTITDPAIDPSISLKLNHKDFTLSSKDPPAQLKVKISGTKELYSGEIVWSSADTNVATVSETGLVERVGRGSTVITAEANGQVLECIVRVP